jgi:uncharacterized protein YecT (DUF1311 family)
VFLSTKFFKRDCPGQEHKEKEEIILFGFQTPNGKTLSITTNHHEDFLVYRFGTKEAVELEYPKNKTDSWDKFQHSWYFRNGGVQNEGMDMDYLYFDIEHTTYVVFQEYHARTETMEWGIKVINRENDQIAIIRADTSTIIGSLAAFRDLEKIPEGEELFTRVGDEQKEGKALASFQSKITQLRTTHQDCLDEGGYMLGCSRDFYIGADNILNEVYQTIRKEMLAEEKEALKQKQLLWLKTRDRKFKEIEDQDFGEYGGGHDEVMFETDQKADFVLERAEFLISKYLDQGSG